MANAHRGEIEAHLDGKPYALCLTLGALAELEHAFGEDDMIALASRFETGRISATDCVRIVGAGLRGGGQDVSNDDVARMQSNLGAAGFIDIVVRLLTATFGSAPSSPQELQSKTSVNGAQKREEREVSPFPGKTS